MRERKYPVFGGSARRKLPGEINRPDSIFEQGSPDMINMTDQGMLRRMDFRDGLSLSEIERRTG